VKEKKEQKQSIFALTINSDRSPKVYKKLIYLLYIINNIIILGIVIIALRFDYLNLDNNKIIIIIPVYK